MAFKILIDGEEKGAESTFHKAFQAAKDLIWNTRKVANIIDGKACDFQMRYAGEVKEPDIDIFD